MTGYTIPLSVPGRVTLDAGALPVWQELLDGRVAHVGSSMVVLEAGRHVMITGPHFGLAPGGIQLAANDFVRVRSQALAGRSQRVCLTHWASTRVELTDLSIYERPIDPMALHRCRIALTTQPADGRSDRAAASNPMNPAVWRARAPYLAAAEGATIADAVGALIGGGPGSTPSGDDVIVGVLAGLRAGGAIDAADSIAATCRRPLERLTTTSSAHYLSAAADGRFADRVHELVGGLRAVGAADHAIGRALSWGATSGFDLLAGIVAGAHSARTRRAAPSRRSAA